MILSRENRFLFVKGSKVAGTSLEVLLSDICGPNDIITPITPIDEKYRLENCKHAAQNYGACKAALDAYLGQLGGTSKENLSDIKIPKGTFYNHMPLREIIEEYGNIPGNWHIFAIERCPYRKILSRANMSLNFSQYQVSGKAMKSNPEALKREIDKIIEDQSILSVKNIDLYKTKDGSVLPEILKFENMDDDIEKLMLKLKVKNYPKISHLKKGMRSNSLDLKQFFSKRQIQIINELFEDEFTSFDYQFM